MHWLIRPPSSYESGPFHQSDKVSIFVKYVVKCWVVFKFEFNDWMKRWGKTAYRYNSQVRVPAPTRVWELCVSTLTCWENVNIKSVRRGECSTHITPGTLRDYEISSFDLMQSDEAISQQNRFCWDISHHSPTDVIIWIVLLWSISNIIKYKFVAG